MIKYFPILIVAIFIDGFQGAVTLSFLGAGAGFATAFGWVPFIGQALAWMAVEASSMLSIAINFSFSATFGAALVVFLLFNKLFDIRLFILGGGEVLPFLNILPFWSGLVLASIYNAHKKQKKLASSDGSAETSNEDLSLSESEETGEPEEFEEIPQGRQGGWHWAPQTVPTAANDNHLQQKLVA